MVEDNNTYNIDAKCDGEESVENGLKRHLQNANNKIEMLEKANTNLRADRDAACIDLERAQIWNDQLEKDNNHLQRERVLIELQMAMLLAGEKPYGMQIMANKSINDLLLLTIPLGITWEIGIRPSAIKS